MKDIPGYEELYAVTEDGKVWSYPKTWISGSGRTCHHDGKFLAQFRHSGGYLQVALTKDHRTKLLYVHRLVAQTYVPNDAQLAEVNHKNADKRDNHYSNLEWVSRQQNAEHAKRLNLYTHEPARGERHADAKLTDTDVLEIRYMWDAGMPLTALHPAYDLSKSAMYAVCTRQSWTHI